MPVIYQYKIQAQVLLSDDRLKVRQIFFTLKSWPVVSLA